MKQIDFKRSFASDRKMNAKITHLLRKALAFTPPKRIKTTEEFMFDCYEILRAYNIRFTRQAIKKYLIDARLVAATKVSVDQDIYIGYNKP
jgi:hypothetical protein